MRFKMTPGPSDEDQPLAPPPAGEDEENEVLRAVRERKQQEQAAEEAEAAEGPPRRLGWKTAAAAGIGIGSAAVLAALLYANRDRK